jgi:hypothetical protein
MGRRAGHRTHGATVDRRRNAERPLGWGWGEGRNAPGLVTDAGLDTLYPPHLVDRTRARQLLKDTVASRMKERDRNRATTFQPRTIAMGLPGPTVRKASRDAGRP